MENAKETAVAAPKAYDYTQSEAYQASKRNNAGAPSLGTPTLSELEELREKIQENIDNWEDVRQSAKLCSESLAAQIEACETLLKDTEGQRGVQVRYDRLDATDTLERIIPKLQMAQRRLANAKIQLKTWTQRQREFPVKDLHRLRREEVRRQQMKGRARGNPAAAVLGFR